MISKAFLMCALSLPINRLVTYRPVIQYCDRYQDSDVRDRFFREYDWLMELLKSMFPDHEFMILPKQHDIPPQGWDYVIIHWRDHFIYKRPLRRFA